MDRFSGEYRFDRLGRLVGDEGLLRLKNSHVLVVGLGGVGSWAAEALARSGVGRLGVVDFDRVCIMNFNRQMHALDGTVGELKAELIAERMRRIHPESRVDCFARPFSAESVDLFFKERPDFVIDAIDHVTSKCFLLDFCRREKIRVVCSTGAGARLDPTRVRVSDLADTEHDPLARAVRKIMRQEYGWPRRGKFHIPAVYSEEETVPPKKLSYDGDGEFRCRCDHATQEFQSCDKRRRVSGTAAFVTGAFGLACASVVVRGLLEGVASD
jgi:tRNA A37 threonylcarbamoyladenosine dehydratase